MIRPLVILTISLSLLSCDRAKKKAEPKTVDSPKYIDILEPDHDTLPNGKRLLDNMDSGMVNYYKEVVGSDTLKGGYITCYGIDDSNKYFYLRHGNTLHLLNQGSILASTWGLGTLEKDLDNYFITRIDNGNGVPETYQVFDKKSGKNILGDNVAAWNFKNLGDTMFFLYDNTDSIFLFNAKTNKRQGFKLKEENPDDIIYYDIKNITTHSLTIIRREHYTDEEKLVKYRR